jgi:hypothetical protein
MIDASAAREESGQPLTTTPDQFAATQAKEQRRARLGAKLADNKWVERSAKLGYAARGLLYLIAGITMALAAVNLRDPVRGMRASLDIVMGLPLGRIAVGLIAIGLFGYIFRRIVQLMVPPAGPPPGRMMRLGRRLSYLWSGLINIGIALTALQLFIWSTDHRPWGFELDRPIAPRDGWLLFLTGLGLIGYAGFEFYMAVKRRFTIDLAFERMSKRVEGFILWCGIVGYTGRGIAFFSLGALFVYIGWNIENLRIGNIFETLEGSPYTFFALACAAAGLIAYGLYLLFASWYLRFIATW